MALFFCLTLLGFTPVFGQNTPVLAPAFVIDSAGSLTTDPGEVIDGKQSIKGSYSGNGSFTSYLHTDAAVFPLAPGRSYGVTFRYKILVTPDKGFQVFFASPIGASNNNFLPGFTITGSAGATGTATLTSTLDNFNDYLVRWNVVGKGAISIDDIQIVDVKTGEVLIAEDAEGGKPQFRLAQQFLPPAQAGRTFSVALSASGGVWPYTWRTGVIAPPAGLQLMSDGYLSGKPTTAGSYLFDTVVTDSSGATSRLSLRLTIGASAGPLPSPDPLTIAGGVATVRPQEYKPAFRNPLGGMRPEIASSKTHPFASLGRQYIEWNLLENSESDTVDKIRAATDKLFGDLPGYNIKAVPRVYLIWPSPLAKYWPSDLSPDDYTSPAFRSRMKRLIARLGEAWDSDPRIAFIETGIIGYWGEQHDPSFASTGASPSSSLPDAMEKEFGDAYRDAFPHKLLMNRNPRNFVNYQFGTHWDVFGSFDQGFYANDTTGMTNELQKPNLIDRWKIAPRGGETGPTFLNEPDFSATSLQNVVRKYTPRLIGIIQNLHWNHLAVLDSINPSDQDLWDKASQIQNALGYRFVIDQADYSAAVQPGQPLSVHLKIRNTGSSPFYYPWPLDVALLDAVSRRPVWHAIWDDTNVQTWLPGGAVDLRRTFTLPADIPAGQYALALAILDPNGMVPSARFAVANYWAGGRTPLGPISVGGPSPSFQLNEFDDLQADRSLYYFPPITNLAAQNSASFAVSPQAPGTIAYVQAPGIAPNLVVASDSPWPTLLAGVHLEITDSSGQTRPAPIYYVSSGATSFLVPTDTAVGAATVKLTTSSEVVMTGTVAINSVSPGLFTANSSGTGAPAGFSVRVAANGAQTINYLFDLSSRKATPVDLGAEDQVYLSLYGTGFRNTSKATAAAGGVSIPVLGIAPTAQYQGLDVINVGPLPLSLAGKGEIPVVLTFDGQAANIVIVNIR